MRTAIPIAAAALALAAVSVPEIANAASCREQLQDFERRLYESSLAADDPEEYAELSRQAEEISELRDEELCARRLAELSGRLPPAETAAAEAGGARD